MNAAVSVNFGWYAITAWRFTGAGLFDRSLDLIKTRLQVQLGDDW